MAGGDVAEHKSKGKGKKKKGRRLGVRIDMTPLVDVAFLLLTFFMYTTSMSRPQTMEINLPPDKDVKVDVPEIEADDAPRQRQRRDLLGHRHGVCRRCSIPRLSGRS